VRELTEVAPGVLVTTARLYTTTSTVLADGHGGCLVVDPAVTVAEVAGLAAAISALDLRPVAGWSTHPHWDHVLWAASLGDVPRYATGPAAAVAERERDGLIDGVTESAPGHDLDWFGQLTPLAADAIPWAGPPVRVLPHDAHETGHGALFLPDSGVLIAGDMLSDLEIPLLPPGGADPVGRYRAGLELLAGLDVRVLIPGHGHVAGPAEFRRRAVADRAYLADIERGASSAGQDERIGTSWLRAEHDRQFGMLHP
jgi:glyoxylase-like metal-dependent hydrolase (beta-lactamase superfamily II)